MSFQLVDEPSCSHRQGQEAIETHAVVHTAGMWPALFLQIHIVGCCTADHWESQSPVASGAGVLECQETQHVLHTMLMIHPNQAGSLQGHRGVNSGILAVNDPGNGTGWQQSKQNWALLAVVGTWSRMECSDRCCGELSQHHPFPVERGFLHVHTRHGRLQKRGDSRACGSTRLIGRWTGQICVVTDTMLMTHPNGDPGRG